jgi:hypothetical protein
VRDAARDRRRKERVLILGCRFRSWGLGLEVLVESECQGMCLLALWRQPGVALFPSAAETGGASGYFCQILQFLQALKRHRRPRRHLSFVVNI